MKHYPYLILDIEGSMKPIMHPWQEGSFLSSIGIQTPDRETSIWFFNPLIGDEQDHLRKIQMMLDNTDRLVGHFFKFDMTWLMFCGLRLPKKCWCTAVGDYVLNGQNKKLERTLNAVSARNGFGSKIDEMAEYWERGINTDQIPVELHTRYLTQDLNLTHDVYLAQRKRIKAAKLEKVVELTCSMSRVLARVELVGAPFNLDKAQEYYKEALEDCDKYLNDLCLLAGNRFNPSSSLQLRAILYGGSWKEEGVERYFVTLKSGIVKEKSRKCKVDVTIPGMGFTPPPHATTKGGEFSTSSEVIEALRPKTKQQKEFLATLLEYKKSSKIASTLFSSKANAKGWINLVSKDGRLHGSFNQIVTATARLSSSNPNMQNLPRSGTSPLKKVFTARDGYVIIDADLSQIEWRIAAELSRDPVMIEELRSGVDIHDMNAVHIFKANLADKHCGDPAKEKAFKEIRTASKVVSFRLLYGGSHWGFYFDLKMPNFSEKRWKEIVDAFYDKYKGLKAWQDRNKKTMLEKGHIRTPSGRIIPCPDVDFNNEASIKSFSTKVCNYPDQSFSADAYNVAVVKVTDEIEEDSSIDAELIMLVHDSMVFECKLEHAEKLCCLILDIFENLTTLISQYFDIELAVPLGGEVDMGKSYGETSEVKTRDDIKKKIQELSRGN